MTDVHQRLGHIEKLMHTLIDQHEKANNDLESLEQKYKVLNDELTEKSQKIQELEGELRAAKIARGVASGSEDTELAKARISTLVREIDRCIALLNE